MALATLLCVLSPIPLLMLAALSEILRFPLTRRTPRQGWGCALLIVLVAVAVTLFLLTAPRKSCEYAFLENDAL